MLLIKMRPTQPIEWLQYGLETRRHEKRGRLRRILIHHQLLKDTKVNLWKRVLSDYKYQQACFAGMKAACEVMGTTFKDPRAHVAKPSTKDGGRFVSERPKSQKGIPKGYLALPYLYHAYDIYRLTFQRQLKNDNLGFVFVKPYNSVSRHMDPIHTENRSAIVAPQSVYLLSIRYP